MIKLTNKDRMEFIENTLDAAFNLRFDIIQDRINDFGLMTNNLSKNTTQFGPI